MANKGQLGSATPIINCNVVMPNDMFGFLCPAPTPAFLPAPPLAMLQLHAASLQVLIPPNLQSGIKQDITTFCHTYGLSDKVLERFKAHAYTGTQAFWYINMQELKDLGFKPGEIVDLKEAVLEWTIPAWCILLSVCISVPFIDTVANRLDCNLLIAML